MGGLQKSVKVWAATWTSPTPSSSMATSLTSSATHTHAFCNIPHDRQNASDLPRVHNPCAPAASDAIACPVYPPRSTPSWCGRSVRSAPPSPAPESPLLAPCRTPSAAGVKIWNVAQK